MGFRTEPDNDREQYVLKVPFWGLCARKINFVRTIELRPKGGGIHALAIGFQPESLKTFERGDKSQKKIVKRAVLSCKFAILYTSTK